MPHTWIAVETDGYDLEDLAAPRQVSDVCPACTRKTTLVARELVRNLRVLGVPLVATARAGEVFQCTHCGTCFEPPPEGVATETATSEAPQLGAGEPEHPALATLTRQLRDADDEAALWRMRMDLATRKREPELAREARALIDRYAAVAETLRAEIAALPTVRTVKGVALPAAVAVEDELTALRRRVAERASAKAATPVVLDAPEAPETPVVDAAAPAPEAPAAPAFEDELAALKRRLLGDRPAPTAPATPAAPATGTKPEAPRAEPEDDMAALKRKLRGK